MCRFMSPAWSNQNLHQIARVTTRSRVLAHVRAATQEFSVTVSNCHPFRHGALTFMHNGDFRAFSRVRRSLLQLPVGCLVLVGEDLSIGTRPVSS